MAINLGYEPIEGSCDYCNKSTQIFRDDIPPETYDTEDEREVEAYAIDVLGMSFDRYGIYCDPECKGQAEIDRAE